DERRRRLRRLRRDRNVRSNAPEVELIVSRVLAEDIHEVLNARSLRHVRRDNRISRLQNEGSQVLAVHVLRDLGRRRAFQVRHSTRLDELNVPLALEFLVRTNVARLHNDLLALVAVSVVVRRLSIASLFLKLLLEPLDVSADRREFLLDRVELVLLGLIQRARTFVVLGRSLQDFLLPSVQLGTLGGERLDKLTESHGTTPYGSGLQNELV